jgi:hypothetical protein
MKHNRWSNIKQEHHILPDFVRLIMKIGQIPWIIRIIPGRISRQQKWSSEMIMSLSYPTDTGLKYLLKKWSTVQECFITCDPHDSTISSQIQALCTQADIIYKW